MIGTYHGARFWCNLDGCGMICVVATWGMILYSVYVVAFVLLRPTPFEECLTVSKVITSLAFAGLAGVAATAHVRTMLTNPGAVPRHAIPVPVAPSDDEDLEQGKGVSKAGEEDGEWEMETSRLTTSSSSPPASSSKGTLGGSVDGGGEGGGQQDPRQKQQQQQQQQHEQEPQQRVVKWCHKCDAFKPPRAHHCSLCQRCIVKMDHHCPWVNNCVGIGNQKLFLLFCAYTCALCVFALLIEGVVLVFIGDENRSRECRLSPGDHVSTVALASMSIMFGLFTLCMACDQCQVASTNQTKIDRLKGEVHESNSGANEVFGGTDGQKCRCHWAIPIPARFPAGDAASGIFGYCSGRNGSGRRTVGDEWGGQGMGDGLVQPRVGVAPATRPDDVEMAEYGVVLPDDHGDMSVNGVVSGGALGETALRHAGGRSLEERVGAMHERDTGSDIDEGGTEGRFR